MWTNIIIDSQKIFDFLIGPEIVKHCKFFSRMRDEHLREIVNMTSIDKVYLEGDQILRPGIPMDYLYVIADGKLERKGMGFSAKPIIWNQGQILNLKEARTSQSSINDNKHYVKAASSQVLLLKIPFSEFKWAIDKEKAY